MLIVRRPPMRTGGGSKDEFVPIVKNYEGVRRMCGGNERYAHLAKSVLWPWRRLFLVLKLVGT